MLIRFLLSLFVITLACVGFGQHPHVPLKGSASLAVSGSVSPLPGLDWEVVFPGGTAATSLSPGNWTVSFDANTFTIHADGTAQVAANYELRYSDAGVGKSAVFDLVARVPAGTMIGFRTGEAVPPIAGETWQILRGGTTVATSTTSAGWTVGRSGSYLQVTPPFNATRVTTYEIRYATNATTFRSGPFEVVAPRITDVEVNRPAWQEVALAKDSVGPVGIGPSRASSVDLRTGVFRQDPEPDIVANNPAGPSAIFQRAYKSNLAMLSQNSPGLPIGWTHNFDFAVISSDSGSWATLALRHPNGATENFTPVLSDGLPTGAFSHPPGAPYVLEGVISGTTGAWTSLTLRRSDRVSWVFTPSSTQGRYCLTAIVNVAGHYVTISKDSSERVLSVLDESNNPLLAFTYSGSLLSRIDDWQSRKVEYVYNTQVNSTVLQKVSAPNASASASFPLKWQYAYTNVANLPMLYRAVALSPSGSGNSRNQVAYNSFNYKATKLTDANDNARLYSYSLNSTAVTISGASGTALSWNQRFSGDFDGGITDAKGNSTSIIYGDSNNPASVTNYTNRKNQSVSATYDAYGNILTSTDLHGVVTTYTYVSVGIWATKLLSTVHETSSSASKTGYAYEYYPNGQLYQVWGPQPGTTGASQILLKEYTYTSLGNVATLKVPNSAGTLVTYTYTYFNGSHPTEKLGEPVAVQDPLGNVVQYAYDATGRLTHRTETLYDSNGFPFDSTTEYVSNLANQITTVWHPSTNGSTRAKTIYTYDYVGGPLLKKEEYDDTNTLRDTETYGLGDEGEAAGEAVGSVTVAQQQYDAAYQEVATLNGNGNETEFGYDTAGFQVGKEFPSGNQISIQVDQEGFATGRTDAQSRGTAYVYDTNNNNLLSVDYDPSTPSTLDVTFSYDSFGRVTGMADDTGTYAWTYDDLDNILTKTSSWSGLSGTYGVSYTYNADGTRATMVVSKDASTTWTFSYNYNNSGQLASLYAPWIGGATATYEYHPNGMLRRQRGNLYDTWLHYDARGRLARYTHDQRVSSGTPTRWIDFGNFYWSTVGEIGSVDVAYANNGASGNPSGNISWQYDALHRPTLETWTQTNSVVIYSSPWTYDNAGNITNSRGTSQSFNSDQQLSGVTYDADGNAATANGNSLTYDRENRVESAGGVSSKWSYDGLRQWKDAGGKRTYYIYDGDQKVVEIAGSGWTTITVGSQVSTYAYGPFGLISRWNQANTKYDQFVFDIFGSPLQQQQQATTNPLGNLIYDSKGELKVSKLASTGAPIPTSVRYDIGALSQWGDGTDNELLALQQDLVILANGLVYNPDTGMATNRTGNVLNEYQANLLPAMIFANVGTGLVQSIAGESLGRAIGDGLFGTSDLNKLYGGDWAKVQQLTQMNGQVAGTAWGAVSGARVGMRAPSGLASARATSEFSIPWRPGGGEWHHPIPKFMGGLEKQELYWLTTSSHRRFHSMLRTDLKAAGFPKRMMGGPESKQAYWMEYYARNSGSQRAAYEVLKRTTRDFDRQTGTNVMGALERNLVNGRYRRF